MKRAIYVDYENVSLNGLTCVEKLTNDDSVKIFIGKQSAKLSMSDADRIFNCKASIELITNQYIGKNALDFIIMVHLGYDIAKETADEYFIISKDKGYDPAILEMKKKNGSVIKRYDDINMVLESEKTLGKAILGFFKKNKDKENPDTTEHTVFGKKESTLVDNEKLTDGGKRKQKKDDDNHLKAESKKGGSKEAVKTEGKKGGSKETAKAEGKKGGSKEAVRAESKKGGSKEAAKAERNQDNQNIKSTFAEMNGDGQGKNQTDSGLDLSKNVKGEKAISKNVADPAGKTGKKKKSKKNKASNKDNVKASLTSKDVLDGNEKNPSKQNGGEETPQNTDNEKSGKNGVKNSPYKGDSGDNCAKSTNNKKISGGKQAKSNSQRVVGEGNGTKNSNENRKSGENRVENAPQKAAGSKNGAKNSDNNRKSGENEPKSTLIKGGSGDDKPGNTLMEGKSRDNKTKNTLSKEKGGGVEAKNTLTKEKRKDLNSDNANNKAGTEENILKPIDNTTAASNESVIKAEQIRQSHARAKQRRRSRRNELSSYRNAEVSGMKNEEEQASKLERYQSHKLAMVQTAGRTESTSEEYSAEGFEKAESQSINVDGSMGKTYVSVEKERDVAGEEQVDEAKIKDDNAAHRENMKKKRSDEIRRKNRKKSYKHVEIVETVNYDSNWKNRESENGLSEKTKKETAEETLRRKEREEAFALLEELEVQEQSEKKAAYIRRRQANRRKNG